MPNRDCANPPSTCFYPGMEKGFGSWSLIPNPLERPHSTDLTVPPSLAGLNGGMNVNGFSTVSHPSTSGTFSPGSAPTGAQPLRTYDCLWDYTPPYGPSGGLKDGAPPALGQFPLNGVAGGSRPASPGHGTNLRPAGQEFWGNGTSTGPMGLNFDSQELYESFHEQSFELMQNGPDGFYTAGQSSAVLSSDTQPFPLAPDEPDPGRGDAGGAAKEMPNTTTTSTSIAENGGGLVGSQELEEAQPGKSLAELWVGAGSWLSLASSSLGNCSCSDPPAQQCPGWGLVVHSLEKALGSCKTSPGCHCPAVEGWVSQLGEQQWGLSVPTSVTATSQGLFSANCSLQT